MRATRRALGTKGGHKQMWFAARDVALEHQPTEGQLQEMMTCMAASAGYSPDPGSIAKARAAAMANRLLPEDIDFDLELAIVRMSRLLLIELVAFLGFAWAEEVLSDTELVAGDGEAARLVSYVRADESPHVAYLQCALSEMRDRTFKGTSGRTYAGTEMVGRIWDHLSHQFLVANRFDRRQSGYDTVLQGLRDHPQRARLLEEFHTLGHVRPGADGSWQDN